MNDLNLLKLLLLFLLAWGPVRSAAHEFWLMPVSFDVAAGQPAEVALFVGENFSGERVAFAQGFVTRFTSHHAGKTRDLRSLLGAAPAGSVSLVPGGKGTHLLVVDTQPSEVELEASKFNDYLRIEGLDHVVRERSREGKSGQPARERYRRNVKSLVKVGAPGGKAWATRVGQKLEIVPQSDPSIATAGPVGFTVYYEGRPLANALLKCWFRDGGSLVSRSARTGLNGNASLLLDRPGAWIVSVVHMVPARDPRFDWDSYWANLSFQSGPRRPG